MSNNPTPDDFEEDWLQESRYIIQAEAVQKAHDQFTKLVVQSLCRMLGEYQSSIDAQPNYPLDVNGPENDLHLQAEEIARYVLRFKMIYSVGDALNLGVEVLIVEALQQFISRECSHLYNEIAINQFQYAVEKGKNEEGETYLELLQGSKTAHQFDGKELCAWLNKQGVLKT